MSGHSKWHQIKRKKEATDTKRGQQFTRLAQRIKQAARAGTDPAANRALADAIAQARGANMPQESIDRLLHETTGGTTSVRYEAFGPGGSALIVAGTTDNNNRTVAEVRAVLKKHGGTMGQPGSVMWKFTAAAGGFTAQFPRPLDTASRQQLAELVSELQSHTDVTSVYTDVA